jgi:hypothetical protein
MRSVCCRGVTHEEVRPLLPAYAAGTLPDELVDQVRAHLASGCLSCLGAVYDHPVGLPRAGRPIHQPPDRTPGRGILPLAILAGLAAVAAGGWGWNLWRLRTERADHAWTLASERARLTAMAEERAELATRLTELEGQAGTARRRVDEAIGAHGDAEAERARLEGALAEAQRRLDEAERDLARRDRRIGRLLAGVDGRQPLRKLLDAPGLELVRLEPAGVFRDVRGHVLWNPSAGTLAVYAYDLPRLPGDRAYRLRLLVDGQVLRPEIPLSRDGSGLAVATVRLNGDPARLAEVQVVRDPGEEPVLAGRLGPRAG